jgi:hypothetical protein
MPRRSRQRLTFLQWKGAVNAVVVRRLGLHCDDLPDYRYRDDYEDGVTPLRAAARVIKAAKKELGL